MIKQSDVNLKYFYKVRKKEKYKIYNSMKKNKFNLAKAGKTLSAFLILFSFTFVLSGQNILDFNSVLGSTPQTKSLNNDFQSLKNYYVNYTPSLLIGQENIKKSDPVTCRVADVSLSNLSLLYGKNSNFEDVEFLKIYVKQSDRKNVLDIAKLTSFTNLKYILFEFDYDTSLKEVVGLINNSSTRDISLFYYISIPN